MEFDAAEYSRARTCFESHVIKSREGIGRQLSQHRKGILHLQISKLEKLQPRRINLPNFLQSRRSTRGRGA